MQNLSELTRRLIEAKVEFVLIGGFAVVAHGGTLLTRDLDICCRFSDANLRRTCGSLFSLGEDATSGLFTAHSGPIHHHRKDQDLT